MWYLGMLKLRLSLFHNKRRIKYNKAVLESLKLAHQNNIDDNELQIGLLSTYVHLQRFQPENTLNPI